MAISTEKKLWVSVGLALLSAMCAGYSEYNHNDRDIIQRVSVLESHRSDDSSRLDRIENKLDQLITYFGAGRK